MKKLLTAALAALVVAGAAQAHGPRWRNIKAAAKYEERFFKAVRSYRDVTCIGSSNHIYCTWDAKDTNGSGWYHADLTYHLLEDRRHLLLIYNLQGQGQTRKIVNCASRQLCQ